MCYSQNTRSAEFSGTLVLCPFYCPIHSYKTTPPHGMATLRTFILSLSRFEAKVCNLLVIRRERGAPGCAEKDYIVLAAYIQKADGNVIKELLISLQ